MSLSVRAAVFPLVGCLLLASFGFASKELARKPRPSANSELLVRLPITAQIFLAAGDRYLAANLATVRALVTSTESMTVEDFALQGRIQVDAAWLNPAQEDNYYIAAAILPWYGQLDASQSVLRRASDARPFDWQPPFYYAFNAFYFLKDPVEGSRWLRKASEHTTNEGYVLAFQQIAALWAAKGPDFEMAIRLHRDLIKATRHKEFAAFLEKRVVRLENLMAIDKASLEFQQANGRPAVGIDELLKAGMLREIPADPFGSRYGLDATGRPVAIAQKAAVQGAR